MRVLIIEDEARSAAKLEKYLTSLRSSIHIVGKLTSVRDSITFLREETEPDLIFLDIQLSDGESFEIFRQVRVSSYIIFLTAYDAYSLRAFELNSVDYLLKPFDRLAIARSLKRFDGIRYNPHNLLSLIEAGSPPAYRRRLVVKKGRQLYTLSVDEVACFIREEVLFLLTREGKRYLYEATLEALESELDPDRFFRVNRQCIIHYDSIERMEPVSSNRLRLTLRPPLAQEVFVSQGKLPSFRDWLVR